MILNRITEFSADLPWKRVRPLQRIRLKAQLGNGRSTDPPHQPLPHQKKEVTCLPLGGDGNRLESDPLPIWSGLLLVLALVGLNGLFAAAEYAVARVPGERIESLVRTGGAKAKFAKIVAGNTKRYLAVCRLGMVSAALALGWIGEQAIVRTLVSALDSGSIPGAVMHIAALVLTFFLLAVLYITAGEHYPKSVAARRPEQIAVWSAMPLVLCHKLLLPFVWLLKRLSNGLSRRTGAEPDADDPVRTEEEIRHLMKESHKNGYIDNTELTLVDNIFEFSEISAKKIKIPRTDMICLYADLSYEENKEIAVRAMLTRYPVCDPDKDHIIGFVHIKDLLKADGRPEDIRQIARPIMSVPESMPVKTLLRLMQRKRTQLALLLDEYGGTSGLVTIEDIIEEIVGDIRDEFDEERSAIEKLDDHTYSVDGRTLIEEVNGFFGLDIDSGSFNTIGGWLYSQIEIPPEPNRQVQYEGYQFVITEVDRMRISRVTVRKLQRDYAEPDPGRPERRDVS